jgi:sulfoxide reductase heme-binding subunit YedZ
MSITAAAPTLAQAPYWYLTRSTGIVSFVLMTVALAFGIAATQRALASPSWPRFATQNLHRNVSLLALGLLLVHVVTTIVDGYVTISWWNVVVPFLTDYHRLWTGLGTIASDLLLAIIVTSLLRLSMTLRAWRWVHLSAYAVWPLSFLHFLYTGTDSAHGRFGLWVAVASGVAVGLSIVVRLLSILR